MVRVHRDEDRCCQRLECMLFGRFCSSLSKVSLSLLLHRSRLLLHVCSLLLHRLRLFLHVCSPLLCDFHVLLCATKRHEGTVTSAALMGFADGTHPSLHLARLSGSEQKVHRAVAWSMSQLHSTSYSKNILFRLILLNGDDCLQGQARLHLCACSRRI